MNCIIEQINKIFKPYLDSEEVEFVEMSSIKHIREAIYEVTWMAKSKFETSYSPISWQGTRLDLKDIIRDNKLKVLLGEEVFDLNINIDDIRESMGLKCGNERLTELRRLNDVKILEELQKKYKEEVKNKD